MIGTTLRGSLDRWWPRVPAIARDIRLQQRLVAVAALLAALYFGRDPSMDLVVLIYGTICLVVLLRWPALGLPGLLLASAFVPFTIGTGTGSSINIAMIGIAGLTGLWIVDGLINHRFELRSSEASRPWVALIIVAGISIVAGSAFWSPWVATKDNFLFVQLAQWSIFILAACAFWLGANTVRDRRMLGLLALLVLGFGALGLAGRVLPGGGIIGGRLLLKSPSFVVWVVGLSGGFALFAPASPLGLRAGMAALCLGSIAVPLATGYDWASGWLPTLVVIGVLVALWLWDQQHRLWLAFLSVAMFVGVMGRYIIPAVASGDRWSLDTRIIAWRGLLDMMQDRWLIGLGLASYWHYWRGMIGEMAYRDPTTGYLHYTFDPKVNMHNNYADIFGQMGLLGVVAFLWLVWAIYRQALRGFNAEPIGPGKAYAAACIAAFSGMLFSGLLGDWIFPFVYNIGLSGFRDASVGWLMLGGLVALEATRREA